MLFPKWAWILPLLGGRAVARRVAYRAHDQYRRDAPTAIPATTANPPKSTESDNPTPYGTFFGASQVPELHDLDTANFQSNTLPYLYAVLRTDNVGFLLRHMDFAFNVGGISTVTFHLYNQNLIPHPFVKSRPWDHGNTPWWWKTFEYTLGEITNTPPPLNYDTFIPAGLITGEPQTTGMTYLQCIVGQDFKDWQPDPATLPLTRFKSLLARADVYPTILITKEGCKVLPEKTHFAIIRVNDQTSKVKLWSSPMPSDPSAPYKWDDPPPQHETEYDIQDVYAAICHLLAPLNDPFTLDPDAKSQSSPSSSQISTNQNSTTSNMSPVPTSPQSLTTSPASIDSQISTDSTIPYSSQSSIDSGTVIVQTTDAFPPRVT